MRLTQFQGVVPKLRVEKLGHSFAEFAENCLLHSGAIVPLMAPDFTANTVNINGALRTSPPVHSTALVPCGWDSIRSFRLLRTRFMSRGLTRSCTWTMGSCTGPGISGLWIRWGRCPWVLSAL